MPRFLLLRLPSRALSLSFVCLAFLSVASLNRAADSVDAIDTAGPYFLSPEFTDPVLSPDGKHIGFLSVVGRHFRLLTHELASGKIQRLGRANVIAFWWLGNNRLLFFAFDEDFNRAYYVQALDGSPPRQLENLRNWIPPDMITTLGDDPTHVMVIVPDRRDDKQHGLVDATWGLPNVSDKEHSGGFNDDDLPWSVAQFDVDKDLLHRIAAIEHSYPVLSSTGELRATWDVRKHKWTVRWLTGIGDKWTELTGDGDQPPFSPMGIARDDRHLIVLAHDQGDTVAVMSLDPATGQRTLLAQRPDRDVSRLIRDSTGHFIIGAGFCNFGPSDTAFFDPADAKLQAGIDRAIPGVKNELQSASSDNHLQIIASSSASCPTVYSLLDRQHGRISELGSRNPGLKPALLGRTENFQFKCADGLTGFGYIVLPPAGPNRKPAPLVVIAPDVVGDEAQTSDHYRGYEQYLASRGYAVAHFALRGTAGFGQRFLRAGNFQFADQVPQDLEAGLRFLAGSGWIDPKRIAIAGFDHGGLMALRLAANSTSYRSVIAINAPGIVGVDELRSLHAVNAPETLDIKELRAHYARNPTGKGSTHWDEIHSLYIDSVSTPELVSLAGGTEPAANLVKLFSPESFVPKLTVPALAIYSSFISDGTYDRHSSALRSCFSRNHKNLEWYELAYENNRRMALDVSQQRIWTKVADYLDKTLK